MDGKRGRALTELELRHLRILQRVRDRDKRETDQLTVELEDYVLELSDAGATVRSLATALNIGSSTVQDWLKNARRRRGRE